jgi:hypothetical protein
VHNALSVKVYELRHKLPEQLEYHGITQTTPYRLLKLVQC